ncbi:hypothetical protein CLV92_12020 [Kineococcus xinjiangensis]|uniref:Uncharacterized protein n=1 Tax=Kineococcus xinjiangensis TaxID=512762 RepID=A0A2S6ICH5_9ACTN|nr:hypothetical protein [Kineococcus xinjiangensis]PPK91901.1 hypothetical protein CLV92_12020 [Kineococcus xinjiangensis]
MEVVWRRSHGGRLLHALTRQPGLAEEEHRGLALCGASVDVYLTRRPRHPAEQVQRPPCPRCSAVVEAFTAPPPTRDVTWMTSTGGRSRHACRPLPTEAATPPDPAPADGAVQPGRRPRRGRPLSPPPILPPVKSLCGRIFTPAPARTVEDLPRCRGCINHLIAEAGLLPAAEDGMLF